MKIKKEDFLLAYVSLFKCSVSEAVNAYRKLPIPELKRILERFEKALENVIFD